MQRDKKNTLPNKSQNLDKNSSNSKEETKFVNTEISHECVQKLIPQQTYINNILESLISQSSYIDKLDIPNLIFCTFFHKSISRFDLQNMIGDEEYKQLIHNYLNALMKSNAIYHSHNIPRLDLCMNKLIENNKKMFFIYNIFSKELFRCYDDKCKFKISKKEIINLFDIQAFNEICHELDLYLKSIPTEEIRWHCKLIYKECYSYAFQEFFEFNQNLNLNQKVCFN